MPGGRPTDYDQEQAETAAEAYLQTCGREQTKLPKVTEFYRLLGITRETGSQWQKEHPEFSDTCKKIMDIQQEELIDDGLFGGKEVNASMAIFLLKANHNMIETTHTDITTNGESMVIYKPEKNSE